MEGLCKTTRHLRWAHGSDVRYTRNKVFIILYIILSNCSSDNCKFRLYFQEDKILVRLHIEWEGRGDEVVVEGGAEDDGLELSLSRIRRKLQDTERVNNLNYQHMGILRSMARCYLKKPVQQCQLNTLFGLEISGDEVVFEAMERMIFNLEQLPANKWVRALEYISFRMNKFQPAFIPLIVQVRGGT
jgi:hypothetical protein